MKLDPKKDEKTRASMAEKWPIGTAVIVDGKPGTVVNYAFHSKQYFVLVGGDRLKVDAKRIKPA